MTRVIRGKRFHGHLCGEARAMLDAAAFTTDVEVPLVMPDGRVNSVDVVGTREDLTLLVEVETTERNVVTNARKAAALGLPLWIVVADPRTKRRVIAKLNRNCPELKPTFRVLLLAQMPQALKQLLGFDFPSESTRKTNLETPNPKGDG